MQNKKMDYTPLWDIDYYREKGLYFLQAEIEGCHFNSPRVRVKDHGEMLMFGGYSYLGLINHPDINQAAKDVISEYGTGTHGVRLLAGTLPVHNQLEKSIAKFKQAEAAVTYSSGFMTNLSAIAVLAGKGDIIISDELNHASIISGCMLSRADSLRFRHNDMAQLEKCLQAAGTKRKLVVTDSVFSMDGDIINLPEVHFLCQKYDAILMVDEAHSLGVLGETGHGIEEYFNMSPNSVDIKMGTLSKTIPSAGGYIAGRTNIIEYLKHSSPGFIYSAALPPASAAAALKSFEVIEKEPFRVTRLQKNYQYFINALLNAGFNIFNSKTAIVPIMCGDDEAAIMLSKFCQDKGIFVQPVVYPVVPQGTSRLRTTVTASHSFEDIDYFVGVLKEGRSTLGII